MDIKITCNIVPQEWIEKQAATPEAKKDDWRIIHYNTEAVYWLAERLGMFEPDPRLFKKGDVVCLIDKESSAFKAGAKPYPMIVITDQKPCHINVQVRDMRDRDNELADQFVNPKNLRYATPI